MSDRDWSIIGHILRYCTEAEAAVERFGDDWETFQLDPVYRNAVAMPIQQIGELVKNLTDGFLKDNPEIPWRQIKGMRTWFAHQYLDMDKNGFFTESCGIRARQQAGRDSG